MFAPTRSLSQLATSFIASMCLGILHTLLVALPKALDRVNDHCLLNKQIIHNYLVSQNEVTAFRILCRRRFTFVNRHQFPIFKKQCGGADRDRTCDLLNANQMLSQLSYAPVGPGKTTENGRNSMSGQRKIRVSKGFFGRF